MADGAEQRARDVAIEPVMRPPTAAATAAAQRSSTSADDDEQACTHHRPSDAGSAPRRPRAAAVARLAYSANSSTAMPDARVAPLPRPQPRQRHRAQRQHQHHQRPGRGATAARRARAGRRCRAAARSALVTGRCDAAAGAGSCHRHAAAPRIAPRETAGARHALVALAVVQHDDLASGRPPRRRGARGAPRSSPRRVCRCA